MFFHACVLLIITFCSAEAGQSKEEALLKRDLEHRSNLALLTSIHLGNNKALDALSPNPDTIVNRINDVGVNTHPGASLQATYNAENVQELPAASTPSFSNDLSLTYSPIHRFTLVNNPVNFESAVPVYPSSNLFQYTYGNIGQLYNSNLVNSNNLVQTNLVNSNNLVKTTVPQEAVAPQTYQFQVTREVPVPQPYQVNVIRTVQVPVHIKVPVEVPKPYEVRVPHPVPVPVHIRVPVPVEKPYPVQITKTVAVPVEKPVYIKVPQPIEVPVAQPYPVAVPQPVQIKVPVVVRISERGNLSGLTNLDGTPYVPSAPVAVENTSPGLIDVQNTTEPSPDNTPTEELISSTEAPATIRPSLSPFTGSGLLPPLPPSTRVTPLERVIGGLLSSYVASKEGGVYRRNATKYQTAEYQKTW